MARFTRIPTVTAQDTGTKPDVSGERRGLPEAVSALPAPDNEAAEERFDRLNAMTIRVGDVDVAAAAVRAAALIICQMPATAESTDRNRLRAIARFIALEALAHGGVVDARRYLHYQNIERYVVDSADRTGSSRRDMLYHLRAAGRVLYPQEFTPDGRLTAPRDRKQPATTHAEIERLHARVRTLPGYLGARLQLVLDLTYGAGARTTEIRTLLGSAVEAHRVGNVDRAVVTLPRNAGGVREVPVTNPVRAARLLARAAEVGPHNSLLTGGDLPGQNAVSHVRDDIVRHGHRAGMSAAGLRNRWILDLAERVPAALLMQLSDLVDIRLLSEQRSSLHHYDKRAAAKFLIEGEAR